MPSHRQGNIPKHRARRPDENSGRRSRLNAATPAKRIAPESSPDPYGSGTWPVRPEPPTQPPTQPFPQLRSQSCPPPGAGSAGRSRRMRGLLVTPWFAAGAGFVIAAALSLNSPRTILTYRPNNAPNQSKCADCQSPESVPTSKPGVQIKSVDPAAIGGSGGSGLAVPIQLGPERNGVFSVTFTLPASQAGNDWKLRFALPGRNITQVLGAQWLPDAADDGGEAAKLPQGGYVSPANPAAVSFLVSASGPPVAPVHCVLNGQPCHFGQPPP
jgi:hypothetical protein